MTPGTVGTEPAEVGIIPAVTRLTDAGRGHRIGRRLTMTRGTGGADVRAREHEVRLQIVIESPECPVGGVVAGFTLSAQSTPMHVLRCVTSPAVLGRIMESRRRMTRLAADRVVRADQREMGQAVIEAHVPHPGDLRVTGFALAPQLTHMGIIGMTAGAIERQTGIRSLDMTGRALQLAVRAEQREALDLTVIEAGARPGRDPMATCAIGPQPALMHVV